MADDVKEASAGTTTAGSPSDGMADDVEKVCSSKVEVSASTTTAGSPSDGMHIIPLSLYERYRQQTS